MPFIYRLQSSHTLSIKQLHHALHLTVNKHPSLHTSLYFDIEKNLLVQRVITHEDKNNNSNMFSIIESTYETDEQLNEILHDEKRNPYLFDLAQGLVFRCHIIYYKQISSNHLLSDKDLLIFNFHHALFDFPSMKVFHHDLNQAYTTGQLSNDDITTLRYVDYATIEQQMSMSGASMFWLDALHDCKLDQSLLLPFDRHRLSNEYRSGRGTSISFDFGQDLSQHFFTYASSNNISLEHLTFAIYFIFLFKLTNGQTDLCIAMNINNNRYRDELKSIIGLFENIIPLRCQLDPHWSFHQLLEHVGETTTNSMKYSYFPLQRILNQHLHISKHAFLDTSLEFISCKCNNNNNAIMIDDSQLVPGSFLFDINEDEILNASDFSLSFHHNINMNQFSCTINASLDLFNRETVEKISQRFHSVLKQSFTSVDNPMNKSIYEISLTLPYERLLMQSLNNTETTLSSPLACIHHEFTYQVMKYPQKLAVELDEQSLTYAELLHYAQVLSIHLINKYIIVPGEIICQCVQRSLSMVIGIMAIEMSGGVYCPLSSENPKQRLQNLVEQTKARLILVHSLTNRIFKNKFITYDIDTAININDKITNDDLYRLSNISITPDNISYIVFTSGSTGAPKAVQIRHHNLTAYVHSFAKITTLKKSDNVIQMASCSFDNHFQEILTTLIIGAGLIMLHPHGNKDLTYLVHELMDKDVTFLDAVPSYLDTLCQHLEIQNANEGLKKLRILCSGGDVLTNQIISRLKKYVSLSSLSVNDCQLWNMYGQAEVTITTTYFQIGFDFDCDKQVMSIGKPLPNYHCVIMDEYFQFVAVNQEGVLFVGGACVFAGYFSRDDLTVKVLVEINNNTFYQSGDVIRYDHQGFLYFKGRQDHQIKLRGQRIELIEIEKCLMNASLLISICTVMKWNDDHLIAYVQSSHMNEEQLRQYCQSHLPPHMIPSIFIILDKLPLNPNGKIDRKLLPPPSFSSIHLTSHDKLLLPTNDIEVSIHRIWCDIFKQNQISIDTNIFTIGGHSLLMMQLFHRYKIGFQLEQNQNGLSISDLFHHPTIIHHAQLIQQSINIIRTLDDYHWSSLYLIQARASFAQERIYLDEQIRFSSETAMNNMYVIPLLYRLSSINDHISISRLHHAFQSVIRKHQILRTALYIDDTHGNIIQHCLDANIIFNDDMQSYGLTILNIHNDDRHHMNETIAEILNKVDLFDLSKGSVIRCHILRHYHQSQGSVTFENDDLLSENNHILISIHHAMFDGASTSVFLRDLSRAYQSHDSLSMDDNSLEYIDYSVHEHIMDMTLSREFWHSQLEGYNMECSLLLPVDRQRSSNNQQRSGLASIAEINFDNELCTSFLNYASSHHLTLFQLGLSIFYVFLFKLTHGQTDLCISSINANRYRNELQNLIGMFVSTLPYRLEIDPNGSFDELARHVREKCLSILEHSHYPLQHILGDNRSSQPNASFLETMFDFISVSKDMGHLSLNDANLERISLEQSTEVSKFDFSLTFVYNPLSDDNQLSCSFVCSSDIFYETTVTTLGRRFKYLSPASFAQYRIWYENQRNADTDPSSLTIHNMPFFYRLHSEDILSVKQLRYAFELIVNKHESLHTSLIYDSNKNILMQRILTQQNINNDMFIITESTYETEKQLNAIIENEKCNPQLFDLTQGLVFRCHIIYYKEVSLNSILSDKDIIIFNFHHAFFDFPSMNLFLHDLDQAYKTGQLTTDNNPTLRYIDYAAIERQISMTGASMFWLDTLHDYHVDQHLSLPYDRYRLTNEHRTGRTTSVSFGFGLNLSHHFLIDTVVKISQRFHSMLNQLFISADGQLNKSIYEISLTLPNESLLMQSMNNTEVSFSSPVTCIHHEFVYQVMKHPQKLAVELDDQSLTYCELLYYVQVLSLTLLNEYDVFPGEVVCQCVERSLSMVIGIMGIEMGGGVYCPLSPRDPQHRLHALTQQTQSRLVLVHYLTTTKLDHNIVALDIDSIVNVNNMDSGMDNNCLSNVKVKSKEIAYIIFTSGSSGIPKAIQLTQHNFINSILAFVRIDALHEDDVMIQIASSTFDAHIQEVVGSLICGATIVMLHPQGNMDFQYINYILRDKQVTYLVAVPSYLNHLCNFVKQNKFPPWILLRNINCVGESVSSAFIKILMQFVVKSCQIWNFYGPAEATLGTSCHLIDVTTHMHDLPIGKPLCRYICLLLNNFLQPVRIQKEGELCIGGAGVFSGYLGRDDLSAKALVEIDGQLFYRTGDLVRIDNNGLLHYQGRKDHQIKLHGQRIELGEIERCLLNISSTFACVVMKWNDDYLVAYVQSAHINEEQLREHCQSHLPPHMIPSIFIILDKLPLNQNGKIDRKLLPPPNFSSIHPTNHDKLLLPMNETEIIIHQIWCELLKQNQISTNTHIFTLGGHSLLMMQLFHRYKIEFRFEPNALSITDLFQHPTIIHHAQLIQRTINMKENINDYHWSSLYIIKANVSFAQERIFLDEQIRFSSTDNSTNNMYVIPLIYRIPSMNDHISISQLQHAFQSIIRKHQILRTALYLDANGTITQNCLDTNAIIYHKKSSRFSIINLRDEEHEQNEIVKKILNQSDLFDLSIGHVINCHVLRRDQTNHSITQNNDDLLTKDDLILFTIHHACFDGASRSTFIRDLSLAYQSNDLLPIDDNSLQYIDYSIHEHIMDMTLSQEFWLLELKGYNLVRQLSLPVDRQRSSTDQQRSGLASIAEITFDDELCTSFLNYASSHHLTLFQLGLCIFYVFLFKLTHGETDLCISSINANRYRSELVNMIGMFVSTLPFRVELDPRWSFDEVVKYVRDKCLSILQHSHYSLQHILADLHFTQLNVSFLETMFDFITISEDVNDLCLNGVNLEQMSLNKSHKMTKFDFSLRFLHNPSSDDNQLSCSFVCSRDLFDKTTVAMIGRRLKYLCQQIFAPASFAQARVWLDEKIRFDADKPKVAFYNIPFAYRLQPNHTLSTKQLVHALQLIVNKHESLHTSLIYDSNKNILMQRVLTQQDINNDMVTITESTYETDEQLNYFIENEKCNPQLFDLTQGLVFRCHIIYYKEVSLNSILSDKDII
ncbi:unnamed protein product, partial [Adineta steineri]